LTREDVVRPLMDLHIEIARRAAPGTDLPLAGEPDPHPVLDPGRDLHGEVAPGPDPPIATALRTRVGDERAVALAGRARPRRHHLAQEGALHRLDLAATGAGVARRGVGARRGAGAATGLAQHRRVDAD